MQVGVWVCVGEKVLVLVLVDVGVEEHVTGIKKQLEVLDLVLVIVEVGVLVLVLVYEGVYVGVLVLVCVGVDVGV